MVAMGVVNKQHPWLMLYSDWQAKCASLKDKDPGLYLNELGYWFRSIGYRLKEGETLSSDVYADWVSRGGKLDD